MASVGEVAATMSKRNGLFPIPYHFLYEWSRMASANPESMESQRCLVSVDTIVRGKKDDPVFDNLQIVDPSGHVWGTFDHDDFDNLQIWVKPRNWETWNKWFGKGAV